MRCYAVSIGRPWGFWRPVYDKVKAQDPTFDPDTHPWRDAFNILVGMAWQIALVAMPIYLVIQQWYYLALASMLAVLTSWILKKNWLDKLKD